MYTGTLHHTLATFADKTVQSNDCIATIAEKYKPTYVLFPVSSKSLRFTAGKREGSRINI